MKEAMDRIDSKEFTEWIAFWKLEPWGYDVDNYRAGLVSAVVANTVRDPKKRRKPYQPADFMPIVETTKGRHGKPDQQTLRAKIDSAMIAFGGKKRKKKAD